MIKVQDVLDENEVNYAGAFVLIKRTTMIIMATVLILLLCTQFSEILSDSEYFSILYGCLYVSFICMDQLMLEQKCVGIKIIVRIKIQFLLKSSCNPINIRLY